MTVRKLQADGDITTSGTQFISGVDEVAQTISTRLKLYLGEYFRDISDGVPWFEQILGKKYNRQLVDSIIRQRIIETEGVTGILQYGSELDTATRKLSISTVILTAYGQANIETQI